MTQNTHTPIKQAIEALLIGGNHIADELISRGCMPERYKSYDEILEEFDSSTIANLYAGWSGIMEFRDFLPTLAELTKLAEAVQWRPIETVIKDRRILLYTENGAYYVGQWVKNLFDNEDAFLIASYEPQVPDGFNQLIVNNATHWMPLPEPPQQGGNDV